MNYKKIEELLNDYDQRIKLTVLRVLKEEEQKISMSKPKGIKEKLQKIIEEMIEDDNSED
ncbi:hypothetical protein BBF96_01350 [Anoxybacter fermentans]|uniref:Uncharacterized protein n=1 Tax=Anoxybacter fermentans TaxID=1323375 RepID=A0A3S9SV23_9FIRM|nr:hypothetical protein [Anoxybacter fermentans]AZR72156.1 hypothetical protein BBF96_01350 [Anoxybacter fermentans]